MIRIGIDYSLNSPAVCIEDEHSIQFMSFFNADGLEWKREKLLKKFYYHNILSDIIPMFAYNRNTDKSTYQSEQVSKMRDAEMVSDMITEKLTRYMSGDCVVSLEGFAFQSQGAAFIDLIMFNSFLRKDIIRMFGYDKLMIVAPTSAKKLAGKGNANKDYMINAFIENKLGDEKLAASDFYKYVANNELDYKNIKPIDDLVDAYWILKSQSL